jgi:hypothetical protein
MLYGQTPSGREANPSTIDEVSEYWSIDFLIAPEVWLSSAQKRDQRYFVLEKYPVVFKSVSYRVFDVRKVKTNPLVPIG